MAKHKIYHQYKEKKSVNCDWAASKAWTKPGVVAHAATPSTQEAEAEQKGQSQPGLHDVFMTNWGYIARSYL